MTGTPGMRAVAEHAGVSLKTVSRVVNGQSGVSEALRTRVERSIGELGYRLDGAGRVRERARRTRSIAVLVQDVANAYSGAMLRAVCDYALESNVVVLTASLDEDPVRERQVVAGLAHRVDGMVVMSASYDQDHLAPLADGGLPLVLVDRVPLGSATDTVTVDNATAAQGAVRHLIDHGHRRIGLLADDRRLWTARHRCTGYGRALADAGLPDDPDLRRDGLRTDEDADRATADLLELDDPPTALFSARNELTLGVVTALHRLGRQHDVALVGFDDLPLAALVDPGISVVAQDPRVIGRRAAALLLQRIEGFDRPQRTVVLPTSLVRRGSGELPGPVPT